MEKAPKLIKHFTKREAPEERTKVASEIWKKRSENRDARKQSDEQEKEREKTLAEINKLGEEIADLSENGLTKIKNYFKLRALRAELKNKQDLAAQAEEIIPPDLGAPKKMLKEFYLSQKIKWENSPYKKEDIETYFTEENLASLSLEDYALLMKRFPGEMVTHVTRQGIRERVAGHGSHNKGHGEFHNGFVNIIENGRLRSHLGIALVEEEKGKAIEKYFNLDKLSKEDALKRLDSYTETGSYGDKMAIHFATDTVADYNYGAEAGNEIFFAFPSAQIASQYYFNGRLTRYVDERDRQELENDQFVWANEEKGIDINSGIVFIPADAIVNTGTGSQYELNSQKRPILNEGLISPLKKAIASPHFLEFIKARKNKKNQEELDSILISNLQIDDQALRQALISSHPVYLDELVESHVLSQRKNDSHYVDYQARHFLEASRLAYKKTSTGIPSKEYWENYFRKNADKKPNKIVYYKGVSPTEALDKWKEENGISKFSTDEESFHLGFEERRTPRRGETPDAIKENRNRFRILAESVINNYYARQETAAA